MRQASSAAWIMKAKMSCLLSITVAIALLSPFLAPSFAQATMPSALPDLAGQGPALNTVTMSISPLSQYVVLGQQATVDIYVNPTDGDQFYGMDMTMTFNTTILQAAPQSVTFGPEALERTNVMVWLNSINNDSGQINWFFTFRNPDIPITEPDVLGTMTFDTLATGTAYFTWTRCIWGAPDGYDYDCTTATGSVTVGESPNAVDLRSFTATSTQRFVLLNWQTTNEVDNLGFNIYRADAVDGKRTRLNTELIPTLVYPGSPDGASYSYRDTTVRKNKTSFYWLEDLDIYGQTSLHGPVELSRPALILPWVNPELAGGTD
jgi:hypothetical protein